MHWCEGLLELPYNTSEQEHGGSQELRKGIWVQLRMERPACHDGNEVVHYQNLVITKENPMSGDENQIRQKPNKRFTIECASVSTV